MEHVTDKPPMDVDHHGVHLSHCCDKCGCRYGDDDCPVATGKDAPIYQCEDCVSSREQLIMQLRQLSPAQLLELFVEVMTN